MEQEKAFFPIVFMCRVLGIGRAGYYAWLNRRGTPGPQKQRRTGLAERIKELFDESNQTSGARRIQAALHSPSQQHALADA